MFSPKLEKFEEFKSLIDDYLAGELSQDDTLTLLEELKIQYAEQAESLLKGLKGNAEIVFDHMELIKKLQNACKLFESARAGVEHSVAEELHEELESYYEDFQEGNRLLLDAHMDIEEILEQNQLRSQRL